MMDDFVNSFINEARELLNQLEGDLLLLEQMPGDREITDNIFRVMHTVKGAARMFGFDEMQNVAHEFENVFDRIRSGKVQVSKELINDTLKAKDILIAMLERNSLPDSHQEFVNQLKRKYTDANSKKDAGSLAVESQEAMEQGMFCILFKPDLHIFERGLNPEKAIEDIKAAGKTRIIVHDNAIPWAEQKTLKLCQTNWEIYLSASLRVTEINAIFLFYDEAEYKVFDIKEKWSDKDPALLDFFLVHYDATLSLEVHLLECTRELKENDHRKQETSAQKESHERGAQGPSSGTAKPTMDSTINVSSHKLDELMNLVSELVISAAALDSHAARIKDLRLNNLTENIEKLTKKFRGNALDLRLIPVGTLLNKYKRQVRDLSEDLGKEVNFVLEGQETEIDKTVLKAVERPLMHIIRNSIDHGIESPEERLQKGKSGKGMLKIIAFNSGANVIIQVHDDGRGINMEKIRECAIRKGYITPEQPVTNQELLYLIMEPGFSTSENVSIVSGRGVGMDVVRKELNAIGGSLVIETEKELGTSITMKLPTTLSIIDTLMLEVNGSHILIPLLEVEYCYKEDRKNIYGGNRSYLQYKNNLVPFVSLRHKFKFTDHDQQEETVIIINKFDSKYAIVVDDIIGEQQAVIKPLGEMFINQPYFSGGSIMADGNLSLVLDTNYLFNQSIMN